MSLSRRQLSLFGVEAADPSPLDLAGLLFGPGQVTRMGGTARIAVTVDAAWRVHVLAAELGRRGIEISWRPAGGGADAVREPEEGERQPAGGGFHVLTAYSMKLAPLAALHRPAFLSGPRLRLWVAAAGTVEPGAVRLGVDPAADPAPVEGALARAGLAATLVDAGAAFRVTGRRRLARLAELVGDRPAAAPEAAWPNPAE